MLVPSIAIASAYGIVVIVGGGGCGPCAGTAPMGVVGAGGRISRRSRFGRLESIVGQEERRGNAEKIVVLRLRGRCYCPVIIVTVNAVASGMGNWPSVVSLGRSQPGRVAGIGSGKFGVRIIRVAGG